MADWHSHYRKLIDRARNRALSGYTERHHIIPRCMGGTDDPANLAELTPEEHFVAHQLLVKMYPGEPKLVFAAMFMTRNNGRNNRNNKQYGWLRRLHSQAASAKLTGIVRSPETRARMSAAAKARGVSALFRQRGAEAARANGAQNRGKRRDPAIGRKISEAKKGKTVISAEGRANMSAALKGRKLTLQHRQAIGAALLGKVRGPYKKRASI